MRRKRAMLLVFVLALAPLALVRAQVKTQAAAAGRTLKVKLNYTGAGTVDEKHKIYVLLFDANPFTASTLVDSTSEPIPPAPTPGVSHILVRQGAAAKDTTLTFRNLPVSPVFAVAFYDKNGNYNGQLDQIAGSPMGVYGKLPDKLEPIKIEEGNTLEIVLAFNDSAATP